MTTATHPGATSPSAQASASQIVGLLVATLKNEKGVHAESAIAAAAVLTGEYVQQAANLDFAGIEPGSMILSDKVNELLFESDQQMTISDYFFNALFSQGIEVGKETWPENIPEENQVMFDPLQVAARLRGEMNKLLSDLPDALERAYACAQATALLVAQARRVLDPNIGKALALEAMLKGAKTVPLG